MRAELHKEEVKGTDSTHSFFSELVGLVEIFGSGSGFPPSPLPLPGGPARAILKTFSVVCDIDIHRTFAIVLVSKQSPSDDSKSSRSADPKIPNLWLST